MLSIKSYGAKGDGTADDFAAIQSALDSGEKEIYIPMGIYCVSGTLLVHSDTHIVADNGAKIVMKSKERRKRNEFLLSNADVVNGNKNISIAGGIWDGNNTQPENAKPDLFDKNGYSGAMLNFVNVENLTLSDMVLANSVTFYVRMSRLHNFRIEDISFVSDKPGWNQDGLHFGGDVKHGFVKNIRALSYGQTSDDMIALNADDSIERVENLDLVRDAIEDITFENIYCECCHTIIRMLSVTAPIRDIRFKNIYGGFNVNAINADAARYCKTPLFKEEDYPLGVGAISNITFDNFACKPVPGMYDGKAIMPTTALRLEANMDSFNISDFNYIADEETKKTIPAAVLKNLTNEKITADGSEYIISQKGDVLAIPEFVNLKVNKF